MPLKKTKKTKQNKKQKTKPQINQIKLRSDDRLEAMSRCLKFTEVTW